MVRPLEETSLYYLQKSVLRVTNETSDKFVPAPSRNQILSDLLIGLKRFRNVVRWKHFFAEKKRKEEELKNSPLSQPAFNNKFSFETEENENARQTNPEGLKSGLKPANQTQNAPIGSPETESFLKELEETLIKQVMDDTFTKNARDENIRMVLDDLCQSNEVVVSTDKTNSIKVVKTVKYEKWVNGHLETSAKEINREKILQIFELATAKCEDLYDFLDEKEYNFLKSTLKTRNIPTPKLIIKDHKKLNEEGDFPSRLIVPANNFTSAFPRLGYLGIRRIFDSNKIKYEINTITQASDLKEELEKLDIKKNKVTIAKLDIVAMYPSIQFKLVRKAIEFFAQDLPEKEKEKIEKCLEMISFGMSNTIVNFKDKFFEYDGDVDGKERGLTIGGYESAWLADLVAVFILEKNKKQFENTIYHGIYRDDGFIIFKGVLSASDIKTWLSNFQKEVDNLAESNCLQFTLEVWGKDENESFKDNNMITMINEKYFPYLDMEMSWNKSNELIFRVHLKPNQKLKYMNSDSTHLPSTFKAIPQGVLARLGKLTSKCKKL